MTIPRIRTMKAALRGIESGGPKYSHYLLRVQTDCFVRKNPEFKRGTRKSC